LKVVDLFCGCGGASVGIKSAGHEVVAAVDINEKACNTYYNNLGLRPICKDLNRISGQEILAHYGINKNDVDLVIGCPPCQGFSSLRATTGTDGNDKRNHLVSVFLKRIDEINPQYVIFENVVGILNSYGRRYLDLFIKKIQKQGYHINSEILVNVADYGIPQRRKRVVIMGIKESDFSPKLPVPTFFDPHTKGVYDNAWKTVRDAIGDLPPLMNGEKDLYIPNHVARLHTKEAMRIITAIPKNGGGRKDLPQKLWLPCHKRLKHGADSVYGRMEWDKPAPTITCRCTTASSGRFIHPEQDRAITIREAARLQTFPDTFVFPDVQKYSEQQIGNAVPPQLIKTIITNLAESS